ncbi:hypothetical protein [Saccharicrinis aurantiacus]|uniref:hypothetical protein n=1 Tax=Saccharicrinis aurantiacus TaxID=1849719 RepID=UPI0011150C5F|nr:hypothetical protein [Saccharicrinis aurantiacus]
MDISDNKSTGFTRKVILFAPFIQFLLSIILIEQTSIVYFKNWQVILAITISLIAFVLLTRLFLKVASRFAKIGLLVYIPCVLIYHFNDSTIVKETIAKLFEDKGRFELFIKEGCCPLNHEFIIEQEKMISSTYGVDSLFIYGIEALSVKVLTFKMHTEMCEIRGVNPNDVLHYLDSTITSIPNKDIISIINTAHYKGISIRPLVSEIKQNFEKYKPHLFKSSKRSNDIDEYTVMFEIYCTHKEKTKLMEELLFHYDSLKKENKIYDFTVRIER